MSPSKTSGSLATFAVLALLTIGGCAGGESGANGSDGSTKPNQTPSEPLTFTAGEYSAEGTYIVPTGTQQISVRMELDAEGTVVDLKVTPRATSGNSVQFQGQFVSGINAQVVGRPITELDIDKVSGSSLTSDGFNKAVTAIIEEATS